MHRSRAGIVRIELNEITTKCCYKLRQLFRLLYTKLLQSSLRQVLQMTTMIKKLRQNRSPYFETTSLDTFSVAINRQNGLKNSQNNVDR